MNRKINWDALGIAASVACAIHCAVLPLMLSSLPLFGVNIIDNIAFEITMIFIAACIGCYSLYHGWKKHHHNFYPLIIFFSGMLLLLGKQLWHLYEIWLLIPAVIFIISAHFLNYRLCRVHNHAHKDDCNH